MKAIDKLRNLVRDETAFEEVYSHRGSDYVNLYDFWMQMRNRFYTQLEHIKISTPRELIFHSEIIGCYRYSNRISENAVAIAWGESLFSLRFGKPLVGTEKAHRETEIRPRATNGAHTGGVRFAKCMWIRATHAEDIIKFLDNYVVIETEVNLPLAG